MARRAFLTGAAAYGISVLVPKESLNKLSPELVDVMRVFDPLMRIGLLGGSAYASLNAIRREKSSRSKIEVNRGAVEKHIAQAHVAFQDFLEQKGMEIFEKGSDDDIATILALSAELTAWMEAIEGTSLDIRSRFNAYPAIQLQRKSANQATVDGLSVGLLEKPDSIKHEGSGGYGNGVVVRSGSGRLYMVSCKHVSGTFDNKKNWTVHPDERVDLAVLPLSNHSEWAERAVNLDHVTQAIPGSLNYLMSINTDKKAMPTGELQYMGIALPNGKHMVNYMIRHASKREGVPLEFGPIAAALEAVRPTVLASMDEEALQKFTEPLDRCSTMIIMPPYTYSRTKWFGDIPMSGSSGAPLFGLGADSTPVLSGILSMGTPIKSYSPEGSVVYDMGGFVGGQHIADLIERIESKL